MFSDPATSSAVPYSQPPRKARKRHKPIARVTSYDYNVLYDIRRKQDVRNGRSNQTGLFSSPIRVESYNVMEGEILMSIDKSSHYRDGQLHCFSFANGLGDMIPQSLKAALMEGTKKEAARTITRFMVMDRLNYVGIAVTGFDASHDRYQDVTQGFVATFGGLNTIINTGAKEIRPGDVISVGLPPQFKWEDDPYNKSKQAEGVPLDKLLFSTNVVTPAGEAEQVAEIVNAFNALGGLPGVSKSQMPVALRGLENDDIAAFCLDTDDLLKGKKAMHVITSILDANRRNIIGKALSFARPGEPFDIVLGGSNSL